MTGGTIYTIGHSTRPIDTFVDMLRGGNVQCVVDVRTIPRSRTNPDYNLDSLPETLSRWQIRHRFIKALGGRRGRQKQVAADVNGFWDNQSFHNYADYALSPEFLAGLHELEQLARETCCAIMCSEAVWWRCHRRIIADYLIAGGWNVLHLMDRGRIEPARMTPAASVAGEVITYPPPPQAR
ncbi:hypothetical protein L288_00700 [Sphingobium quisquiliarum P25]|uniref:DNA repair protein n=1 Tax=Sphingobium quisquiliarum P25 TaxID=1329909 RepID=T0IYF1_9SPHN|nr:DUF488 family protein [Sphingobium quisquiliarum]EQB14704.1 hypothetical protein L288_00700 [Sphingobium quisquiliarum P25]